MRDVTQEKEEREAGQKKQEEETAKIYEQFVASFDAEDEGTKVSGLRSFAR